MIQMSLLNGNRQEINEEDQAHLSEFDLGILYILWSQSQTLVLLL